MKSLIWRLLYRRWRAPVRPPKAGYSLLLPMPGDLPFFLDIFARVFADKNPDHVVETLVIPDQVPPGFQARFDRLAESWPLGEIRLIPFRGLDRFLAGLVRNPFANCWLQLVNGVNASTASHAFFHDADAFVTSPDFYEARYEECVRRDLVCLGVNRSVYGVSRWMPEAGVGYIAATWELIFRLDWARQFPPWRHRGHKERFRGQTRLFDITLLPQALTSPDRIDTIDDPQDYIHFSHVICMYREFQAREGPWEDAGFTVLLVRLLIDAFDPGDWPYDAPSVAELARGITDASAPVTYRNKETASKFPNFRSKLEHLVGPIFDESRRAALAEALQPFERAFGDPVPSGLV